MQPISECEFALTTIIEQIQRDPWPVAGDHRPLRCTGAALGVAIGLIEAANCSTGSRIMLFTSGAATVGPGMITTHELKESLRSHNDLEKDIAKHWKKAQKVTNLLFKYYESLAKRCTDNSIVVDIFAGCGDQVGLMEMKSLVNSTNGYIVLSDSFSMSLFKQSFTRIFKRDKNGELKMGFNGQLEVQVSKELRVCGLIGNAFSGNQKSPFVGETEIGLSGTNLWKFCGIEEGTTVCVYLEVASQVQNSNPGTFGIIQLTTMYRHSNGQSRLRVTTIPRMWTDVNNPALASSFDQEAAAVLMSRIASYKAEVDDGPDVLRWLDRMLIRVCQRFANYSKDDMNSFQLSPNFSIYPQFMYHLRRSQFLQVFNNSPDETTYARHVLNREDTNNSLIMIQPTLMQYSMDNAPQPVLLDSQSIQQNVILLMDTFFHILIYHGETIAAWRRENYHHDPSYIAFKEMLELPQNDAQELLADRFPCPRFVDCDAGGSQARFLLAKVNPSTNHSTGYGNSTGSGQAIATDDVSLQVFMDHLKKLAVAST